MKTWLAFAFAAALGLRCFGMDSGNAMSSDGASVDCRRIVPGAYGLLPASYFPVRLASGLDGLSVQIVSVQPGQGTTNVSARSYTRTSIHYAVTGGTLENATNYFPYVKTYYLSSSGFSDQAVAFQDAAVFEGPRTVGGRTYQYAWRSDCWVRSDAGTAYFVACVPSEGDETYRNGFPLVGGSDGDYDRGISVLVSQDGDRMQYVTVDENMNVYPSNVLATAAMAAEVEARLLLAEESARAQTNAYTKATEAVNEIARAITDQQVTIYQDDYVYSFGEVVSVSTNCRCRIYRFDAKIAEATIDGMEYFRNDVYFGYTEDIGTLSPVAWIKSSQSGDLDWDDVLADEIVPQTYSFEKDGETYSHCYLLKVYVPKAWNAAFIKVFTEVTSSTGDGSHVDFIGGAQGGFDGTVNFGGLQVEVRGGFLMAPEVP